MEISPTTQPLPPALCLCNVALCTSSCAKLLRCACCASKSAARSWEAWFDSWDLQISSTHFCEGNSVFSAPWPYITAVFLLRGFSVWKKSIQKVPISVPLGSWPFALLRLWPHKNQEKIAVLLPLNVDFWM